MRRPHVTLFATCLVDALWPSVAVSTVRLLRRAGCTVSYDERQTCCGQPAFNTGYRNDARSVARALIETYERNSADAIVVPSGSCAAMFRHLPSLFDGDGGDDDDAWRARASAVGERACELATFLVRRLGALEHGARFDGRLTWHDACHGLRDLGIRDEPRELIAHVAGAELVELGSADSCCGFGGTFSVKYPELSVAMLDRKLADVESAGVRAVVSGDAGCLMQIGGRLARRRSSVRALHLAELLDSHG